jgi:uncharacterized membrane protein (UPF0127 family)
MRGFTQIAKGALAALFLLLAGLAAFAQVSFEREELTIETADGRRQVFSVELAVTPDQRSQGLMHRKEMLADAGMLFDFGASRPVSMWMKNTILPLDMLFIRGDGRISHIHENAEPFSEAIIDSHGAIKFVLELNAGRVKALGIRTGDRVLSPRIGNMR